MSEIREIFATYINTGFIPSIINIFEDRAAFELARESAKIFTRVVSILNNDSIREDDPILTILCITENPLETGEPETISQEVINWLMDNGHMEIRF